MVFAGLIPMRQSRKLCRSLLIFITLTALWHVTAWSQSVQAPPPRSPEVLKKLSDRVEAVGLVEPFKGITTHGEIEPGLFDIRSTGVSTALVRNAADVFLASLTRAQRDKTVYAVDDVEWRKWMNTSFVFARASVF